MNTRHVEILEYTCLQSRPSLLAGGALARNNKTGFFRAFLQRLVGTGVEAEQIKASLANYI